MHFEHKTPSSTNGKNLGTKLHSRKYMFVIVVGIRLFQYPETGVQFQLFQADKNKTKKGFYYFL